MDFIQRVRVFYMHGSMTNKLITINVFVFLCYGVLWAIMGLFMAQTHLSHFFDKYLVLHSNLATFIKTPWTLITSGFIHAGFWHILFNMLWLYWIGNVLEEYIGARKVLPVYLYGVLIGGLFFILAYNFFPLFKEAKLIANARGASAGVMAIIWATVALLPEYRIRLIFLGSIPLLYIALFMSVLDFLGMSGTVNPGGKIAHLGGALMGYLYIFLYKNKGIDLSKPVNSTIDSIANMFSKRPTTFTVKRGNKKQTIVTSKTRKNTSTNHAEQTSQEEKLNVILDKINESGYNSLTASEKEFLFRKSSS